MTAKELFITALELCGFGANDIFETADISDKLLSIVNTVYSDIYFINNTDGFVKLESEDGTLNLGERELRDCAVYGVASLIKNIMGSAEDYAVFEGIYNQKKQKLSRKCEIKQVKDTLVKGCDF